MEQMRNDWNLLKDKLEIDIIKKYASYMNIFTISVIVFCSICVFVYVIFQRLPLIFDVMLPLNGSRPYHLVMTTEYFVSQDKYIQFILLHEFLVICIGFTTIGSTGAILITFVSHVCALLKIASYRIENVIDRSILAMPSPKKQYLLQRRMVHAVVMHQRAAELVYFYSETLCQVFYLGTISYLLYLIVRLINRNCIEWIVTINTGKKYKLKVIINR
ncbi:PREDICTED: uncharacterized protein LOC105570930 [Vollenhovia emeryi]|uniref:uncharacterized protein LOC105570930 n=1 Tax=Vollenhovia emeryi TaxID=411798 RepID=UPI0005F3C3CB|nr:PREDICTED: uncharacterized protein LOC105570930 [Vollenhovia emeryi]